MQIRCYLPRAPGLHTPANSYAPKSRVPPLTMRSDRMSTARSACWVWRRLKSSNIIWEFSAESALASSYHNLRAQKS